MNQAFKKVLNIICVVIALCIGSGLYAQTNHDSNENNRSISIMTYNLKFASPTYKPLWEERRDMQVDLIRKYNPDIIGTQEGLKEQIDYLEKHLPGYVVVGEGRQGGDDDEHMAIFYKKEKFRIRELNSFALSNTPDVIPSGPQVNPRIMTWARLAFKNEASSDTSIKYPMDYRGHWDNTKEFYVFNTHLFNGQKPLGRLNASKLIMERINELNRFGGWTEERPVFLMGDFNCHPESEPHKVFVDTNNIEKSDAFQDTNSVNKNEIDWVLYKGNVDLVKYEEVNYNVNGVYPSDHKPIYVELLIK